MSQATRLDGLIHNELLLEHATRLHVITTADIWIFTALFGVFGYPPAETLFYGIASALWTTASRWDPPVRPFWAFNVESSSNPVTGGSFDDNIAVFEVSMNLPSGAFRSEVRLKNFSAELVGSGPNDAASAADIAAKLNGWPKASSLYEISPVTASLSDLLNPQALALLDLVMKSCDSRTREVLIRRFGLVSGKIETLDQVGQRLGITRERARQIEKKAITKIVPQLTHLKDRLSTLAGLANQVVVQGGGAASSDAIMGSVGKYLDFGVVSDAMAIELAGERLQTSGPDQQRVTFRRSMGLAFLLELAGIGVKRPKEEGDQWIAFDSKFDRETAQVLMDSMANNLTAAIGRAIGPSKLMRVEDFIDALELTLDRTAMPSLPAEQEQLLKQLAGNGYVELLEAPIADISRAGRWVSVDLMSRAREIARAILYGSHVEGQVGSEPTTLALGMRSDLIAIWLAEFSPHKPAVRAIDAFCERYPTIFVRTDPVSWGLVGAGSQASQDQPTPMERVVSAVESLQELGGQVTKQAVIQSLYGTLSGVWVGQIIDRALSEGWIVNSGLGGKGLDLRIGKPLTPGTGRARRTGARKGRLQTKRILLDVIRDAPLTGLSENEVLTRVRERIPDASTSSVYLYLTHILDDLIERLPDKRFRMRPSTSRSG